MENKKKQATPAVLGDGNICRQKTLYVCSNQKLLGTSFAPQNLDEKKLPGLGMRLRADVKQARTVRCPLGTNRLQRKRSLFG